MNFETLTDRINKFNNISDTSEPIQEKVSPFQQYELDKFNWNMKKRNIFYLVNLNKLDTKTKTLLKKYTYSLFKKGQLKNTMVIYNTEVFKIETIDVIEKYIECVNK